MLRFDIISADNTRLLWRFKSRRFRRHQRHWQMPRYILGWFRPLLIRLKNLMQYVRID